jgi:hypothetical protein
MAAANIADRFTSDIFQIFIDAGGSNIPKRKRKYI